MDENKGKASALAEPPLSVLTWRQELGTDVSLPGAQVLADGSFVHPVSLYQEQLLLADATAGAAYSVPFAFWAHGVI